VFIPIYWAWVGMTMHANLHDVDRTRARLGVFAVAETGVVAGEHPATPARLAAVAVAFALACALWWVYFAFAAEAIRHAVRTAEVAIEVIRPVLPYGHLAFIAGIIAIAAATGEVILHPLEHLHTDVAALLFGGTALYLATFGYTRWQMFHTVSTTRLTATALSLALLPQAGQVPAFGATAAPAAMLVVLNVGEARNVPHPG